MVTPSRRVNRLMSRSARASVIAASSLARSARPAPVAFGRDCRGHGMDSQPAVSRGEALAPFRKTDTSGVATNVQGRITTHPCKSLRQSDPTCCRKDNGADHGPATPAIAFHGRSVGLYPPGHRAQPVERVGSLVVTPPPGPLPLQDLGYIPLADPQNATVVTQTIVDLTNFERSQNGVGPFDRRFGSHAGSLVALARHGPAQ